MAIVDLGTFPINTPFVWVPFNPVTLENDRFYALYAQVSSANLTEVYSVFSIRLSGQIENGLLSKSEHIGLIESISETQVFKLIVDQYWDRNFPFVLECQRRFFYSQQSNLADATVNLSIDPDEDYKL